MDFDIATRGLGMRELEQVLERLKANHSAKQDEAEEIYFPARSRRNTIEISQESAAERDMRSPSPAIRIDGSDMGERGMEGVGLWELLQDEAGAEDWEGWVVDGKS
jgi:hypothetical protein